MKVAVAAFATALTGCASCGPPSPSRDASSETTAVDARDVGATIDALADVRTGPPWHADGFTLGTAPVDSGYGRFDCAGAEYVSGSGIPAAATCLRGGWIYFGNGSAWRTNATTEQVESLHGGNAFVACQTESLIVGLWDDPTGTSSVLSTTDVRAPLRELWTMQQSIAPGEDGGFRELVATDQLIAWVYKDFGGPYHLYVAGPHGENSRDMNIPFDRPAHYLAADGPHLVFDSAEDIWMWTVGSAAPENLTAHPADQWAPWVSGNRVVWVDQRDTPTGSLFAPDNPEIYWMDLTERAPHRITHDPPDHPAVQHVPMISGDWAIWMDTRNAMAPNAGYLTDRMEVWGYHFPTGREFPIATGAIRASDPKILAGRVYFTCAPPEDSITGTYRVDFPDVLAVSDAGVDAPATE